MQRFGKNTEAAAEKADDEFEEGNDDGDQNAVARNALFSARISSGWIVMLAMH